MRLKRLNPKNKSGNRLQRHHQFLTENIGNPHLEKHLASVVTLMRISPNWRKFKDYLRRAFPVTNAQLSIMLDEDLVDIDELDVE